MQDENSRKQHLLQFSLILAHDEYHITLYLDVPSHLREPPAEPAVQGELQRMLKTCEQVSSAYSTVDIA